MLFSHSFENLIAQFWEELVTVNFSLINVKPLELDYFKEADIFKLYVTFSYGVLNDAVFHNKTFLNKRYISSKLV